jgi:hypothetical protein
MPSRAELHAKPTSNLQEFVALTPALDAGWVHPRSNVSTALLVLCGAAQESPMEMVILAPDIYVNASVALGSPPDQVARRVLSTPRYGNQTSEWVLTRVEQMLKALPAFKTEAVDAQLALIRGLVKIVDVPDLSPDAWPEALVATARAVGARRVVTDHPDLLALETKAGIEFMSSEAWLLEAATPPPAPVQQH